MSVLDIIPFLLILLVFSISVLFGAALLDAFQESTEDLFPDTAKNITAVGVAAMRSFDYGFPILVFGILISIIISVFLLPTHPIFLVLSILFFIIILIVGPQMANLFIGISEQETMVATAANYPIMTAIWDIIPYIILFSSALVLIIMFIRPKGGVSA